MYNLHFTLCLQLLDTRLVIAKRHRRNEDYYGKCTYTAQ